jgi:hypothetical protein
MLRELKRMRRAMKETHMRKREINTKFWLKSSKGSDHWRGTDIDGSKKFKYLLQKQGVKVGTSSTGLENQFPYMKEQENFILQNSSTRHKILKAHNMNYV